MAGLAEGLDGRTHLGPAEVAAIAGSDSEVAGKLEELIRSRINGHRLATGQSEVAHVDVFSSGHARVIFKDE